MSSTGEITNTEPARGRALPDRHDAHQRHEVLRDAGVGAAGGGRTQRRRPHPVAGGFGLVGRRLVEGDGEVRVLGHLGGFGDPRFVQVGRVHRVDAALDALQPVARHPRHAPEPVQLLVTERKLRERRRLGPAQPHPRQPTRFVHGEMNDGDARRELLGPRHLRRTLHHTTRHVDLPTVVDAPHTVPLDPRQQQRGTTVRTQFVEETDPAVLSPEGDVVLTEQSNRHRRITRHQMRRHRKRDPRMLPHQPTHRRITLDPGQQVVLRRCDHGNGSLVRSNEVPRVSGTYG